MKWPLIFSKHNGSKWMQNCRIVHYVTRTIKLMSHLLPGLMITEQNINLSQNAERFNIYYFFGLGETSYWCNLIFEIRAENIVFAIIRLKCVGNTK